MDTNNLLDLAKARFSHADAKNYLKDKYTSKLFLADQEGYWKATPELIGFLASSSEDTLILVDQYGNPIQVIRAQLLEKLSTAYQTSMSEWLAEYEEIKSKR